MFSCSLRTQNMVGYTRYFIFKTLVHENKKEKQNIECKHLLRYIYKYNTNNDIKISKKNNNINTNNNNNNSNNTVLN